MRDEILDKAYFHFYKALENFQTIQHEHNAARMLYNMAIIQKEIKDYTGSEILCFQAIEKYKKLNKPKDLYLCYNLLGVVFNDLKEYDKAILYHGKAINILDKVSNITNFKEISLNNLGLVYQEQKKYKEAINRFNQALENKQLKFQKINRYARLLDNSNYSLFLSGDTTNVENNLNYALKIRDSIEYTSGIVLSKIHLAEFYAFKQDTIKAISLVKDANKLAKESNFNKNILISLQLLSNLDRKNAKTYLDEYVALSDSLQIEERQLRNKFTRIRFETDEYIEETEKLSEQNHWLILGGSIIILVLSLLYLLKVQRAKNKELVLEKEQQKANEEILRLMLKQQSKLEEGKLKERQRISADLHDGVLSRLFGTRMGLGFLNIEADKETLDKQNEYVDELQDIEKEIRNISHELKNELFSSNLNFITIVDEMIKKQSESSSFEYQLEHDKTIVWNELNDHVKINCYRIIQEALQNINKYAQATQVNITFAIENKLLKLTVSDNGKGFDIKRKRIGIGLKNIQLRAKNIDGEFKLDSQLNKGTTISIFIPY